MWRSLWPKTRLAIITTVAVGVFAGFSVWFINKYFGIEAQALRERLWPTPTAEQVELQQLRKIAGWFSLDCGHVRRREEAGRAITCAQGALSKGRRFYVAFDYVGIDSHGTTGLAAGRAGAVFEVRSDELMGGTFGHHVDVDVSRCAGPPIEKTDWIPYLICPVVLSQHSRFIWDGSGRTRKPGALEVSFTRYKSQDGIVVERIVEVYRSDQDARAQLQKLTKSATHIEEHGVQRVLNQPTVARSVVMTFEGRLYPDKRVVIAWLDRSNLNLIQSSSLELALDFEQQMWSGRESRASVR